MTKLLSIALSLLLLATGVSADPAAPAAPAEDLGQSVNLMTSVTANSHPDAIPSDSAPAAAADFAVKLLQANMSEDSSTLLSPLSILCALSMTANGADGETLAQMESVLGMPVEELNAAIRSWTAALPEDLRLANAVWFTQDPRFTVNQDFLQANADWYGAGAYQAPMDQGTCDEINGWVRENTNGMIDGILDSIPDNAVMYLVNALAFDGRWAKPYEEAQVQEAQFTNAAGQERPAKLMYSEEDFFLQDDHAVGFMKSYEGGRYGFAALLPEEGMSVEEYAANLTGESLTALLQMAQATKVTAALPKFSSDYSAELSEALSALGMPLAFDQELADFSALGTFQDANISISRVLHKTHISVDEKGTEAGASTAVEMIMRTSLVLEEEPKEVILNRPFLYLIVDLETNVPVFIGTVMDV